MSVDSIMRVLHYYPHVSSLANVRVTLHHSVIPLLSVLRLDYLSLLYVLVSSSWDMSWRPEPIILSYALASSTSSTPFAGEIGIAAPNCIVAAAWNPPISGAFIELALNPT